MPMVLSILDISDNIRLNVILSNSISRQVRLWIHAIACEWAGKSGCSICPYTRFSGLKKTYSLADSKMSIVFAGACISVDWLLNTGPERPWSTSGFHLKFEYRRRVRPAHACPKDISCASRHLDLVTSMNDGFMRFFYGFHYLFIPWLFARPTAPILFYTPVIYITGSIFDKLIMLRLYLSIAITAMCASRIWFLCLRSGYCVSPAVGWRTPMIYRLDEYFVIAVSEFLPYVNYPL